MKTQILNKSGINHRLKTLEEKISEFEDIREMIWNEFQSEKKHWKKMNRASVACKIIQRDLKSM